MKGLHAEVVVASSPASVHLNQGNPYFWIGNGALTLLASQKIIISAYFG